jgi:heterodisulfide reductase subunit C
MADTDLQLARDSKPGFAALVSRRAGTEVMACYACGKCAAGCPVAPDMDYLPYQILRLVQLGLRDAALASRGIWLCASCVACTVRCPRKVDLTGVMDVLREEARAAGVRAGQPEAAAFQDSFLDVLRRGGRLHELSMLMLYKLRSRDLFGDLPMGVRMMLRGKLRLLPRAPREARRAVAGIFRRVKQGHGDAGAGARSPRPGAREDSAR